MKEHVCREKACVLGNVYLFSMSLFPFLKRLSPQNYWQHFLTLIPIYHPFLWFHLHTSSLCCHFFLPFSCFVSLLLFFVYFVCGKVRNCIFIDIADRRSCTFCLVLNHTVWQRCVHVKQQHKCFFYVNICSLLNYLFVSHRF